MPMVVRAAGKASHEIPGRVSPDQNKRGNDAEPHEAHMAENFVYCPWS